MTTHVFIVDESTFEFHLNYLFAGTGASRILPTFIQDSKNSSFSNYNEKVLTSMLADCARLRKGDNVIFYLQSKGGREGRFYGIFKVDSNPFLDLGGEKQYLYSDGVRKFLPFRVTIRPYKVYAKGVTEWVALDDIEQVSTPDKMIWSLIYRKLRGNRGNTMITLFESKRLMHLIKEENNNTCLPCSHFSFDFQNRVIIPGRSVMYSGQQLEINILPRLIYKYNEKQSHEAHLQAYIIGNLEKNQSLLDALAIKTTSIEWIGNEVSCGVGMQKIDVVISTCLDEDDKILYIIELKDEFLDEKHFPQVARYVKWVKQYYCPNTPCMIQPVLISRRPMKKRTSTKLLAINKSEKDFNADLPKGCSPIKTIEYNVINNDIHFTIVP